MKFCRCRGRGRAIVNTASIAGLIGLRRATAYVAAKHGVVGLTKTAAMEYADQGIRVNAVCPGFITTRMTAAAREQQGDQIVAATPLGRFGEPSEIAEMVVWLCSDRASYVTGVAYAVDGGGRRCRDADTVRHGRACSDHPKRHGAATDGRARPGHDEGCRYTVRCPASTRSSSPQIRSI